MSAKSMSTTRIVVYVFSIPVLLSVLIKIFVARKYTVHESGIIVISGASTGIGRHAAEFLAAKGYEVYAGVRKTADADDITQLNIPHLHPLLLDVTSHDSVVKARNTIVGESERLKLPLVALVNNAGIARDVPLELHLLSDVKQMFETNVFGLLDLTQMFIPLLRESKGRIVMVSSVAGKIAVPLSGAYSASKFAVEAFSDSLRRELSEFGVSVSVVEPAYVETPIFRKVKEASVDQAVSVEGLEIRNTLYGKHFTPQKREKHAKTLALASSTAVTDEAIFASITMPSPKTRYVVANVDGTPAWVFVLLTQILPDRALDLLVEILT